KAIGEQNRKDLEQLQKDLNSPDENTKKAAQKKAEEMLKNANAGKQPDKTEAPKLSEEQKKELADAVKDLQSPDQKKQQEAREKLDKALGEEQRKEIEQIAKDLNSKDEKKQAEAKKKLDDLKNQMTKEGNNGKDGKGKEPTPDEVAELMKKANDL